MNKIQLSGIIGIAKATLALVLVSIILMPNMVFGKSSQPKQDDQFKARLISVERQPNKLATAVDCIDTDPSSLVNSKLRPQTPVADHEDSQWEQYWERQARDGQ